MNCKLTIREYVRPNGTTGQCLELETPKGTKFLVGPLGSDKKRNAKLAYKVCCEIKEAK